MMTNEEIFALNKRIQLSLDKLPVKELVTLTASELHEIWKKTTYIKDENGEVLLDENGNPRQVEKWKKIDPEAIKNDLNFSEATRKELAEAEQQYVDSILSDERFFLLPYIRREADSKTISIDIGKMKYSQLSPKWQLENKQAAEVAVELTLDNFTYLADPNQRDVLVHVIGSAIHLLWKSRPANAYAKETELGQRYSKIPMEEKMKDVRHIFIAEKSIEYISKRLGIDKELEVVNTLKNTPSKR